MSVDADDDAVALDPRFASPDRWEHAAHGKRRRSPAETDPEWVPARRKQQRQQQHTADAAGDSEMQQLQYVDEVKPQQQPQQPADAQPASQPAAQAQTESKRAAVAAAALAEASTAANVVEAERNTKRSGRKRRKGKGKRPPAAPKHPTGKESRLLDEARITKTLYQGKACCPDRHCCRHFDFEAVVALRQQYVGLGTEKERLVFLVQQLIANATPASTQDTAATQSSTPAKHKRPFAYLLGQPVCREGFRRALGCAPSKLRAAVKQWRSGHVLPPVHGNRLRDHAQQQRDFAVGSLQTLFDTISDEVPSAEGSKRVMVAYRSWKWVADWVAADWYTSHGLQVPAKLRAALSGEAAEEGKANESGSQPPSAAAPSVPAAGGQPGQQRLSAAAPSVTSAGGQQREKGHPTRDGVTLKPPSFATVNRARKEHFGNVIRPRKGTLPTCSICVALMAERERCDPGARAELNRQMAKHAEEHRRIRLALQREIDAWLAAGDTVIVRLDYTTNAKVPHYRAPPQVSSSGVSWLLAHSLPDQNLNTKRPVVVKLCGVLVQGTLHHNGFFVFEHVHGVRKDGDSVSTLLWEFMAWCKEPQLKRLVLIVDNAGGEGKNQVVLATLASSTWYDWYDETNMRSLFPGHAHSYVDSLFSHLQRAIRWHTICSLADLADVIGHALHKEPLRPIVGVLERAVGWTAYFASSLHHIHGHRFPLQFKLFREPSIDGRPVRMLTRATAEHKWEGVDKSTEPIQLLYELPVGFPKLLPLLEYSAEDAANIESTINSAADRKKPLIHTAEADALMQIVKSSSSGVQFADPFANDGRLGVPGFLPRPGDDTSRRVAVRVLARAPRSLQAPAAALQQAAHSASTPKPAVPLFWQPRESAISYSSARAKELREAAVAAAEAKDKPASGPSAAASSGSASVSSSSKDEASEPASAAKPSSTRSRRGRQRSTTPTRRSTRTPSPAVSRSPSPMVQWKKVQDDDDWSAAARRC